MADLKPTGRNLLLNTNQGVTGWHWNTNGGTGITLTEKVEDDVNTVTMTLESIPSGSWNLIEYQKIKLAGILPGKPYVLSMDVRDNNYANDSYFRVEIKQANSQNTMTSSGQCHYKADKGEWAHLEFKLTALEELPSAIGSQIVYLTGWRKSDASYSIKNIKLELGTEATPWTPAPEDSLSGGGTNMILAFDVITLATVTDVQGIYRFYQLATSKPSKPTTYPPASAWSDEMPGYQLGNQDSLYFVDVTVFNDLTYQYGEVQLSTDYEAVKATYADALQQIANAEKQMQSEIQKTSESIRTEVSEDYYKKDQTDDLLGTISTALEQTKDSFTMQFNSFQADLENVNADNSAKFQELYQYIRFKGGSIELGETGNTITLTIENDRISFKQAGQEIAYMSNNQLYITDANIVTSLRIGNFIFSPRPNGSLDFKKVGA